MNWFASKQFKINKLSGPKYPQAIKMSLWTPWRDAQSNPVLHSLWLLHVFIITESLNICSDHRHIIFYAWQRLNTSGANKLSIHRCLLRVMTYQLKVLQQDLHVSREKTHVKYSCFIEYLLIILHYTERFNLKALTWTSRKNNYVIPTPFWDRKTKWEIYPIIRACVLWNVLKLIHYSAGKI